MASAQIAAAADVAAGLEPKRRLQPSGFDMMPAAAASPSEPSSTSSGSAQSLCKGEIFLCVCVCVCVSTMSYIH